MPAIDGPGLPVDLAGKDHLETGFLETDIGQSAAGKERGHVDVTAAQFLGVEHAVAQLVGQQAILDEAGGDAAVRFGRGGLGFLGHARNDLVAHGSDLDDLCVRHGSTPCYGP